MKNRAYLKLLTLITSLVFIIIACTTENVTVPKNNTNQLTKLPKSALSENGGKTFKLKSIPSENDKLVMKIKDKEYPFQSETKPVDAKAFTNTKIDKTFTTKASTIIGIKLTLNNLTLGTNTPYPGLSYHMEMVDSDPNDGIDPQDYWTLEFVQQNPAACFLHRVWTNGFGGTSDGIIDYWPPSYVPNGVYAVRAYLTNNPSITSAVTNITIDHIRGLAMFVSNGLTTFNPALGEAPEFRVDSESGDYWAVKVIGQGINQVLFGCEYQLRNGAYISWGWNTALPNGVYEVRVLLVANQNIYDSQFVTINNPANNPSPSPSATATGGGTCTADGGSCTSGGSCCSGTCLQEPATGNLFCGMQTLPSPTPSTVSTPTPGGGGETPTPSPVVTASPTATATPGGGGTPTPIPSSSDEFKPFVIYSDVISDEDNLSKELDKAENSNLKFAQNNYGFHLAANNNSAPNTIYDNFEVGKGNAKYLGSVLTFGSSKPTTIKVTANISLLTLSGSVAIAEYLPHDYFVTIGTKGEIKQKGKSVKCYMGVLEIGKFLPVYPWYGRWGISTGPHYVPVGAYQVKTNFIATPILPGEIFEPDPSQLVQAILNVKSDFPEYVTNGIPKEFIPPNSTINPNIPEGTEEHIRQRHRADYLSQKQYNDIFRIKSGGEPNLPGFEAALNKGTCFDFGIKDSVIMKNILSLGNMENVSDSWAQNTNTNTGGILIYGKRTINGRIYNIQVVVDNNNVNPKGYIVSGYSPNGIREPGAGGIREFYKNLPISNLILYKNNMNE